ncbi:hypothetical protein SOVF_203060 [Spinacia oleracea]|uniref:Uncharacterized protein n=1 Tax=Spinacia oleracea TaxID=3562 RepID=A0A9R0I0W5_SPIOL|nr:uncharacterized protein LOC110780554 [Spinacia oleracea]KNA04070.1 hypothetical protein SOVF_203060 [Spinacia oleracea]
MEEFKNTQVIKVWDILPASKIPTLARELDAWFGKYTMDFMNRCKHKSFQGKLIVPMSWPVHSVLGVDSLSDRISAMNGFRIDLAIRMLLFLVSAQLAGLCCICQKNID